MEKRLLSEVANNIGNDNKSVDELIDKIMKNVEKWAKEHNGELKKLTPEQRENFTQPDYMLRRIAEIRYAKENLRNIVYKNLKRAQGNLGEEDRMLGLYDTLEMFNYSCPYSDTLLIGGEQPIHIDHIIPVSMGGPTDDWNCIPVCGSCNDSKGNRHLLDWWQDNRTAEEEYKLVRIFEHMTGKLLDNSNQIRYLETEDNTKHLDVITFLSQLLDHIEQNKQYILGPNTSILDDNSKAIETKLKELKKTFESVVKKNSDKTLKTDKQYFEEQKQMLKYVKGLGVTDYYKIAYNYFNKIQEMRDNGTSEEEIREFCFDRDDSFNFTLFYEKLLEYKEEFGDCLVPYSYKCEDGYCLGQKVRNVRRGDAVLSNIENQKLIDIEFIWKARGIDDNNIRVALKQFVQKFNAFVRMKNREPINYENPIDKEEMDERNLHRKLVVYKKTENPNEIKYLEENLIQLPKVRGSLIRFVKNFNAFIVNKQRVPGTSSQNVTDQEMKEEKALYQKWIYWKKNSNTNEREYMQNHLIQLTKDNVREELKRFVEDFNAFIVNKQRVPSSSSQNVTEQERKQENRLYQKRIYWNKNSNPDEREYMQNHLIQLKEDSIRNELKQFVDKFKAFVTENKRIPRNYKYPTEQEKIYERNLYSLLKKYRQAKNLENDDEIRYLQQNGIEVRGLKEIQEETLSV